MTQQARYETETRQGIEATQLGHILRLPMLEVSGNATITSVPELGAGTSFAQPASLRFEGVGFAPNVATILRVEPQLDAFLLFTLGALRKFVPGAAMEVVRYTRTDEAYKLLIWVDSGPDIGKAMDMLESFEFGWWFKQDSAIRSSILILPK